MSTGSIHTVVEYMGEKTVLHLNNSRKTSLRTTVPMFIVKQFGLEKGGMLDWSIHTIKGETVAVVRGVND